MHAAGSTGSKASRKQRKSSYATPGAKGKLLPGEKARLKRARVAAKRAARSEGQGFHGAAVVRARESVVQAAGDIKVSLHAYLDRRMCSCSGGRCGSCLASLPVACSVYMICEAMRGCIRTSPDAWPLGENTHLAPGAQAFPPMNMYGLAFTQKAAGLYGLKASAQGSGRKRFVIVRSTNRTQLLEPMGQERLQDMLAAHENALDLLRPGSQAAAISRGKHTLKVA